MGPYGMRSLTSLTGPRAMARPRAAATPVSVASRIYWAESPTGRSAEHGTIAEATGSGSVMSQNLVVGTTGGGGVAINGGHIYWANYGNGAIGRAGVDGSHVDQRFITGASSPVGVVVNGAYVYWTNSLLFSRQDNDFEATIGRAALDGSHVDQRFIVAARNGDEVDGLAVDSRYIYWADVSSGQIGRADLSGQGVDPRFITGGNAPDGVAVNASYVYWSNGGDDTIGRALLDGSAADQHCVVPKAVPVGNEPEGVATDGRYVYWTNYPGDEIGRANLNGTGVTSRFIPAKGVPEGVAIGGLGEPEDLPASSDRCALSAAPVLLGLRFANMGHYAVGWGEAAPPTLSNGGASASGTISDIKWSSWGGPLAQGQGLNPIFRPGGGYYSKPAVIQLRVSSIRRCTPGGPIVYTKLLTREQAVPAGPLGPWEVADPDLCKGEGV